MVHRVKTREREIGIDRPDRLPDLADKVLRAGQWTANDESYVAVGTKRTAIEFCQQRGPVDGGAGGLFQTVVVHISDDADNFAPIIKRRESNAFAQRFGRSTPVFAALVFGNDRHRNLVVDIVPSEITTGDDRYAQSLKIFW